MKDEKYIISGSSYRLLIWDLFTILVQYISLARRLSAAETEKDFKRLQKGVANYERWVYRRFRGWGISKDCKSFACDTLENGIMARHLTPLPDDLEDTAPFDFDETEV